MTADSPEEHVRSLASLATPMALRIAATLRLADHVAGGRDTAERLARAVNVDQDTLSRILRHLCTVGIFDGDEAGRYRLTARGEPLRAGYPGRIRDRLDLEGAEGQADLSLVRLLDTARTGRPAFAQHYGQTFWEYLSANPALGDSFHARMGAAIAQDAADIAAAYDWESLGHVVDVGGGNGTLMIALLARFPALRGTVVDLPGAAGQARAALAAAGLAGRSQIVPQSFFDALPPQAGGYLLASVIHNWDDDAAVRILRRCAEAAGPGGRVFVIEKIGSGGAAPSTETDLRMLAYFGSRERDATQIADLAAVAGLRAQAVHQANREAVIELSADRQAGADGPAGPC
jgi:predicted transcriptional regulator